MPADRSLVLSNQDPSRNPSIDPVGSATSDPKKGLGDIPIKAIEAPRSVRSLAAQGSPGVSHGNGVHTTLVRERGCSSKGLRATAEVRSSGPIDSFWNEYIIQASSSCARSVSSATGRPARLAPIARARADAEVEEKTSQQMVDVLESKIEHDMEAQEQD